MRSDVLTSASGLRPMGAFVVIAAVVIAVAGRVAHVSAVRAAVQPHPQNHDTGETPAYAISDSEGHVLASFVPRFDLNISPRSMWQAHTPRRMAEAISDVLGGAPDADTLLVSMFPDAEDGVIEVDAWDFTPRQAQRVGAWIESGARCERGGPLQGIWLDARADREGTYFRLLWQPEVLLSAEERAAHGFRGPTAWSRWLGDGLAATLDEPTGLEEPQRLAPEDIEKRRDHIWAGLLPAAYKNLVRGISSDRIFDLRKTLQREGVAAHQMWIAYERDRVYPAGSHELFGNWGYARPDQIKPAPREGLESYCDQLLSGEEWSFLDYEPEVYTWTSDRTVRGKRANGFVSFTPASTPPVVESTLDLRLQNFVREQLEVLMDEHEPALAMAMVVDVESGDVLAVQSVERYEIDPFSPIWHVFTTGSTFKILTMAAALEEKVVTPETPFEVGNGQYRVLNPDGTHTARVIREAAGAPTGRNTATMCLAGSSNAGMVQIGLRIRPEAFHGYLEALGYGRLPGSGLGSERSGSLPELPWSYAYTQASLCFGHEISTTVWQHVAGLATVMRGGEYRPLRIVRAVEQGSNRYELPQVPGKRVFSEATCRTVRDMMRVGAREGTGESVRELVEALAATWAGSDEASEDLDLGTKTGTAEKVGSELCVHLQLRERARWSREGLAPTRERVAGLKRMARPHPSRCYTSSIAMFGRAPGTSRELMVFVVAEEPTKKERFGSRVAGPAAARILGEALGMTVNGEAPVGEYFEGFGLCSIAERSELDEPWREVAEW